MLGKIISQVDRFFRSRKCRIAYAGACLTCSIAFLLQQQWIMSATCALWAMVCVGDVKRMTVIIDADAIKEL